MYALSTIIFFTILALLIMSNLIDESAPGVDIKEKKIRTEKQKKQFEEKNSFFPKAELYRQKGDILMMNPNISSEKKVFLTNPYDNKTTEIELDENRHSSDTLQC